MASAFLFKFSVGWAGFVIAFGNFEGTFYRYAKRCEQTQGWQPPARKPARRDSQDLIDLRRRRERLRSTRNGKAR